MVDAYSNMENYEELELLIPELQQGDPLLEVLAEKFALVGLCENAAKCYQKMNLIKEAIDCCVLYNHWNIAVDLADQYNFP